MPTTSKAPTDGGPAPDADRDAALRDAVYEGRTDPAEFKKVGIGLRDYFAVSAPKDIPAWFLPPEHPPDVKEKLKAGHTVAYAVPNEERELRYFAWRWHYADMMIAERQKAKAPAPPLKR